MVPLTPAEPLAINAYMTIPRVTLLQAQDRQNSYHHKQPQYNNTPLVKQLLEWPHQNQDVHSHNQSMVILQQFNIITQELQNFTNKVCGALNKIN